VILFCRHK